MSTEKKKTISFKFPIKGINYYLKVSVIQQIIDTYNKICNYNPKRWCYNSLSPPPNLLFTLSLSIWSSSNTFLVKRFSHRYVKSFLPIYKFVRMWKCLLPFYLQICLGNKNYLLYTNWINWVRRLSVESRKLSCGGFSTRLYSDFTSIALYSYLFRLIKNF